MSGAAVKPSLDKTRSKIVEILGRSVCEALGLKVCLEDERKALEDQDAEALSLAVQNKDKCINEMQALEQQRTRICHAAGFEPGSEQMEQLQEWCDDDSIVANCRQHLVEIAAKCKELNMTNGAIIRVRKQQIETNLSIVRGGTPGTDTYSRNGTDTGGQQQHSLAEA